MFYKIDSKKITLREFAFESKLGPIVGLLGKVLRFPLTSSTDDPPVESIAPFQMEEESLPEEVRLKFQPLRQELESLGFENPIFHSIYHSLMGTQYYWATFAHKSGEVFARIHYRHWTNVYPPRTHLFPILFSGFTDGTWLVTSGGKPDMLVPESIRELRMIGANPSNLWQAHAAELAREKATRTCYGGRSEEELRGMAEYLHASLRDFHLRRGVFVPWSEADQLQARAMGDAQVIAQTTGSQHPEIHAQLEALQRKQSSWGNAIFLLAVSLVLFVSLGAARWDWKFVLWLIPVLFFHELGHYVAMRAFKYRNLRMFFIPLLGAAVSGSHYNVPGWKKVIVSLMGPLPGIIVGLVIGISGWILQIEWMNELALLMLILNGFNLLPILPLDGGWIMHTILFSRSYILDFIFRLLGVAALATLGLTTGDGILLFLSILMALGLYPAWKLARIGSSLRKEPLPQISPDSHSIPFITAERIISEIKAAFPKGLTPKMIAERVLQVFETLNARAPGWLASIFFLGIHVSSLAVAIVGFSFLLVGKHGGLAEVLMEESFRNTTELACGSIEVRAESQIPIDPLKRQTLVANFEDAPAAKAAFQEMQALAPDGADFQLFGRTVLAACTYDTPETKAALVDYAEQHAGDFFFQTTNYSGSFAITCLAATEADAENIEASLEQSFDDFAGHSLLPVWLPGDSYSSDDWQKFRLARLTYQKVRDSSDRDAISDAMADFEEEMARARRIGDASKSQELFRQYAADIERMRQERLATFEDDPDLDSEVVRMVSQIPQQYSTNENHRVIVTNLALRLGIIRSENGQRAPDELRYAASWGDVNRRGKAVRVSNLLFHDPFVGPAALVEWLCNQGCTDVKYRFDGGEPDLLGEY